MYKPGWQTYLNEDKESLVISTADIWGVHGIPFDFHGVAIQLQKIVKTVKSRCGDNDILEKFSMRYWRKVIKW